jgi:hypothetical protein
LDDGREGMSGLEERCMLYPRETSLYASNGGTFKALASEMKV